MSTLTKQQAKVLEILCDSAHPLLPVEVANKSGGLIMRRRAITFLERLQELGMAEATYQACRIWKATDSGRLVLEEYKHHRVNQEATS